MMLTRTLVLGFVVAIGACVTDHGSTAEPQEETARACDGSLYDACTTDSDCASNDCKLFDNRDVQVCTQSCDANNACPDQDGSPVTCNNMGICRPDAANSCTL